MLGKWVERAKSSANPIKKVSIAKASKFPQTYMSSNLESKIVIVKNYYKTLETPTKRQVHSVHSRSPIKIKPKSRIKFIFRSNSLIKILKHKDPEESLPGKKSSSIFKSNIRYSELEKTKDKIDTKNKFGDILRVRSAKMIMRKSHFIDSKIGALNE
ncbi:hypothetical protein SteCoe_31173 [Stentor coeruleus]|uniref:Uncharacterized protein n=1 Tax=Stentor coeruleus TaxID=5963 RepID=A0A1R2B1X4_9CILI|nr:hypothetical protein SteCoe_31173 [Stentor coeruleus]